jgi:hypothetical protein
LFSTTNHSIIIFFSITNHSIIEIIRLYTLLVLAFVREPVRAPKQMTNSAGTALNGFVQFSTEWFSSQHMFTELLESTRPFYSQCEKSIENSHIWGTYCSLLGDSISVLVCWSKRFNFYILKHYYRPHRNINLKYWSLCVCDMVQYNILLLVLELAKLKKEDSMYFKKKSVHKTCQAL